LKGFSALQIAGVVSAFSPGNATPIVFACPSQWPGSGRVDILHTRFKTLEELQTSLSAVRFLAFEVKERIQRSKNFWVGGDIIPLVVENL